MTKQIAPESVIKKFQALQSKIDTTVEYLACWSMKELAAELKDIAENIDICNHGINDAPANGSSDCMTLSDWLEYEDMMLSVQQARKQYQFTQEQFDQIETA